MRKAFNLFKRFSEYKPKKKKGYLAGRRNSPSQSSYGKGNFQKRNSIMVPKAEGGENSEMNKSRFADQSDLNKSSYKHILKSESKGDDLKSELKDDPLAEGIEPWSRQDTPDLEFNSSKFIHKPETMEMLNPSNRASVEPSRDEGDSGDEEERVFITNNSILKEVS